MQTCMTKVEAVKALLKKEGGQASWPTIYAKFHLFYKAEKSPYWQEGIRGVVYREIRAGQNFEFVEKGVIGLKK